MNNQSEENETQELEVPEPVFAKDHTWVQRGAYVVCTSCPFEHGSYIGTSKRLMGIENGLPVLQ